MQGDCSAQDPYADYPGALRCVMEGAGDVAFTKHNIAPEYARDGSKPADWSSINKVRTLDLTSKVSRACTCSKVLGHAILGTDQLQNAVVSGLEHHFA